MMDCTISRKLSNDTLYACYRGRFWRWDGISWKESHLMAQKFERAKAANKNLTSLVFLTNGAEFCPLDDYELDSAMLDALKSAKPCETAPIEPVEDASVQEIPTVPVPAVQEDKPLAFIQKDKCPEFDYSGLSEQTVATLHLAENGYLHGKKLAEKGLVYMGDNIALAHDELCGTVVAQCDNGRFAKKEDTFRAWCLSMGITKDTAYRLLQVSALMDGSSPRQQEILRTLPPTLLYAVAKPSAPPELVEKVKNGEISSNKAYQDLLKENQQLRTDRVNAINQAEREKSRADTASAQLEATRADVAGLKEQVSAAEAREEEAWKLHDKAEARAKAAEEALKHQPIVGVTDPEEVDRLAHEHAYPIVAEMTDSIKKENATLQKDNAALRKRLAALQSQANDNTQADFETANYCASLFRSAWDTCKGSYSRLTGEDLETTFQALCGALNSIMEEASLLCRQPADYDGGTDDEPDV